MQAAALRPVLQTVVRRTSAGIIVQPKPFQRGEDVVVVFRFGAVSVEVVYAQVQVSVLLADDKPREDKRKRITKMQISTRRRRKAGTEHGRRSLNADDADFHGKGEREREQQIHSKIFFAPYQVVASFFIRQIRVISVPYRKI
jgi:hypothetical protein